MPNTNSGKQRIGSSALSTSLLGNKPAAAVFLIVIVAFVINSLVSALPIKYTKIDLSRHRLYSLSPQTVQILQSLEHEIDIYLVAQTGQEDPSLIQLLERYCGSSDKVNFNRIDPLVHVGFAEKYTDLNVDNNSIIVVGNGRHRYIALSQIYVADYADYLTTGMATTKFDGEGIITSAIDYIVSNEIPVLYQVVGHGESPLSSTLAYAVSKQNIDIKDINLLTAGTIPSDADCLLILSPSADIIPREKDMLNDYLLVGGNLLLCTDIPENPMPNIDSVLEGYGLSAVNGIVIEGDSSKFLFEYPHFILPDISDHLITRPLLDASLHTLLPASHALRVSHEFKQGFSRTELLKTSDQAFVKRELSAEISTKRSASDEAGPFTLAAAVQAEAGDSYSRVVWFATSQFLNEDVNVLVSGANHDIFINAVGWLCSRESAVALHAKILEPPYLTVPAGVSRTLSLFFVIVVPAVAAVLGIVNIRKRKTR